MTKYFFPLLSVLLLCTCGPAQQEKVSSEVKEGDSLTESTIRYQQHQVTFSPEVGGRLASYTLKGRELLQTGRDENGWHWGSTVWTSPQSAWNWPPEETFDTAPFNVTAHSQNSITLESGIDPETGLQLEKTFSFVKQPKGMHLQADYRLTNHGAEPVSRGIWENTRVPYEGEFYFISDSMRLDKLTGAFPTRGASTVIPMRSGDSQKGKLFVFPEKGRATYATDKLRFRKLWFPGEGEVAPGQAPLEIYLSPEDGFAEFEIHGPYRTLQTGESITLTVAWKVGELVNVD